MEDLHARYADRAVRSVFIYTHEAHPGENYRHHTSMDDKHANAQAFVDHSNIKREMFLDDLEGSAHRTYGGLPNMTWIVGRGGFIHYKSAWTNSTDVEDALNNVLDFQENRIKNQWIPFYSERSAWSTRPMDKFQEGLERAGPQAVTDYQGMIERNKAKRAPRLKTSCPGFRAISTKPRKRTAANSRCLVPPSTWSDKNRTTSCSDAMSFPDRKRSFTHLWPTVFQRRAQLPPWGWPTSADGLPAALHLTTIQCAESYPSVYPYPEH